MCVRLRTRVCIRMCVCVSVRACVSTCKCVYCCVFVCILTLTLTLTKVSITSTVRYVKWYVPPNRRVQKFGPATVMNDLEH